MVSCTCGCLPKYAIEHICVDIEGEGESLVPKL